VTLRDRTTIATIVPFSSRHDVPPSLLQYLSDLLNKEIAGGDTYPMMTGMSASAFAAYWFQNFGAVMLLGTYASSADVLDGHDWSRTCLGSFYIKPNYPGRSSHVSNAGFLVADAARNRGVGRLMGEAYLAWAPVLGYTYSVFNLVYETNVASCRIWDALGFKKIGRVPGCGNLRSHPERLVDAIIYGRELGAKEDEQVCEERFDKIKFYLKFGAYPSGADRAEKSRLRSAATHYKLDDEDGRERLMLKGREVIADPERQGEIARSVHEVAHGGINRTTTSIAERYHWVRIKETVSDVIRNCAECKAKEVGKLVPSKRPKTGSLAADTPSSVLSHESSRVLPSQSNLAAPSDPFPDPFHIPTPPHDPKSSVSHPPLPQPYYSHLSYSTPSDAPNFQQISQLHLSASNDVHRQDSFAPPLHPELVGENTPETSAYPEPESRMQPYVNHEEEGPLAQASFQHRDFNLALAVTASLGAGGVRGWGP
jgi:GNAT superfamily N-acetyltransferase